MVLPEALSIAIAVGLGTTITGVFFLASALIFYWTNRAVNSSKIAQSQVVDQSSAIGIYTLWVFSAVWDAIVSLFASGVNTGYQAIFLSASYGLILLGLTLALPPALIWTEYHPEIIELSMNVWQCGVVRLFYDLPLLKLLNVVRLLYDIAWPFVRIAQRFTRLALRSIPIYLFECVGLRIFNVLIFAARFVGQATLAVVKWFTSPGSILANPLDLSEAFQNLLLIQEPTLDFLVCGCASIDFIWIILTEWIKHPATARFVGDIVEAAAELLVQIPIRSILGLNTGTIPGVTGDYRFMPNPYKLRDIVARRMPRDAGDIVDYFIFVLVRELAGEFDPSLFQPSNPETVVLASDWVGSLVGATQALLELMFKWVDIGILILSFAIQGIVYLISLLFGSGILVPVGPPVFCDTREWRALLDFGGYSGIYFKDGRVFGALQRIVDNIENLLNLASPLIGPVVAPLLRIAIEIANFLVMVPIRLVIHLIDSEWRMFDPPVPPRVSEPLTFWIPAPSLSPPPVTCGIKPFYPGYLLPWIQAYVDDPDGVHLRVIAQIEIAAAGWDAIWSLLSPNLGLFFSSLLLWVAYIYDVIVQTIVFGNVIIFEPIPNKALFFSRWRYARLLNAFSNIGLAIDALIQSLDDFDCTDSLEDRRFLCLLGDIFAKTFDLVKSLGYQFFLLLITVFVPPLNMPNFEAAISDLEADIRAILRMACLLIPPIPLSGTATLTSVFQNLLANIGPLAVLPFRLVNFILLRIGQLLSTYATVYDGIVDFGTIVRNVITYFLQQLKITLGDNLLVGLGNFIDTFIGGTDGFGNPTIHTFRDFFKAIVDLLDTISQLVTQFAFTLLQYIVAFLASLIGLLFSDDNTTFDDRLSRFLLALKNIILWTILRAPLLLLQLIFGIIGVIVPAPLGDLIQTFGKLLVNGLCQTIQGFIDVVVGVANTFGASLDNIDLCCDSSVSCTPTIKREGPQRKRAYTDDVTQKVRETTIELLKRSATTRAEYERRVERFREVVEKHINKKKRALAMTMDLPDPMGDSTYDPLNGTLDQSYFNPLLAGNVSSTDLYSNNSVSMTLDESLLLVADLVDWDGGSYCDIVVPGLTSNESIHRKNFTEMSITEQADLRDCLMRRTMGELLSVMPYFQWFPKDGFYNSMRWVELPLQVMQAYSIYSQYQSDHQMSRDIVMSAPYGDSWKKAGLNTSHYTQEMYPVFMNWTLVEYFENNNGNLAIADAMIGYWHAVNTSVQIQWNYLQNLTSAVLNDSTTDIESWIFGIDAYERSLPEELQQMHQTWRATIAILGAALNLTASVTGAIYNSGIVGSSKRALVETPSLLKRGYQWYQTLDTNAEYQTAVAQRNVLKDASYLQMKRTFATTVNATADAWTRLWNWGADRLSTLKTKITTQNSPRAKRNWRIIRHALSELFDYWNGNTSALDPNTPPTGLIPAQADTWHGRVVAAQAYNKKLVATRTPLARLRVATFSTGRSVSITAANNSVTIESELQICNSSLVPFCLNCSIVDAAIGETVISFNEVVAYFNPVEGAAFNTSFKDFNAINDYVDRNTSKRTCTGNGTSEIHWPSQGKLINNHTFFEIMGGNDGALIGIFRFLRSLFPSLAQVLQTASTFEEQSAIVAQSISESIRAWSGIIPPRAGRATTSSLNASLSVNITENRILDAANSQTGVDTTYLIFQILPFLKPFVLILDTISHFFTNFSITFTFTLDPITNSMTAVPVFDGSGELGFIGFIWTRFLAADYTYTCERRNLTLLQGALFTGLIYAILAIIISLTLGMMVSQIFATGAFALLSLTAPYVFFILTYNLPVQNLFFLPIPLPPPCLADDAIDTLVCDVITLCPAVFASMVEGPYNESNCSSCPTSLPIRHCKRTLLIADGIDWVILFLQWFFPPLIHWLTTLLGFGSSNSTLIGGFLASTGIADRLNKFNNVDFSDIPTFDAYMGCLGVMFWGVVPGLGIIVILSLFTTQLVATAVINVFLRAALIPVTLVIFTSALAQGVLVEFVFAVTTADVVAMRLAANPSADYARPRRNSTATATAEEETVERSNSKKKKNKGLWARLQRSLLRQTDLLGVEYYWKVMTSKGHRVDEAELERLAQRVKERQREDAIYVVPRSDDTLRRRTAFGSPLDRF